MAIYTKTGDKGETGLFSHEIDKKIRISKSSARIEAIGTIDELNSFLGVAIGFFEDKKLQLLLKEIQRNLFIIGSILAGAKLRFFSSKTKKLEKMIDKWEGDLPVLKNFILPGGSKEASLLFYVRTIARKLERRLVALSKEENVNSEILKYINRLSDFIFVLGRKANFDENTPEETWRG